MSVLITHLCPCREHVNKWVCSVPIKLYLESRLGLASGLQFADLWNTTRGCYFRSLRSGEPCFELVVLQTKHMGGRAMFWGEEAAGRVPRRERTGSAERMVQGSTPLERGEQATRWGTC